MMPPALIGGLAGLLVTALLYMTGMLRERSGMAVLLAAIAFSYPVFAVQAAAGLPVILLHSAVFVGFAALATHGFKTSTQVLALAIMAHGVFDLITILSGHPGPHWWPAFCATLDLAAGGAILWLVQTRKIPA